MVKKFDQELLERYDILSFTSKLYVLDKVKKIATFTTPYPAIKIMNITKDTELEITIKIKSEDAK